MKVVIQRVSKASVSINNEVVGKIDKGLLVLLGIHTSDTYELIDKMIHKIIQMRIFNDVDGKMNESLLVQGGSLLIVSQFTLYANAIKGNRPSFIESAKPDISLPIYNKFVQTAINMLGSDKVQTGEFGANMQVELINDGPVSIILEI